MKLQNTFLLIAVLSLVDQPSAWSNEVLNLLEKEKTPRGPQAYPVEDASRDKAAAAKKKRKVFSPERISRDWLWEKREAYRDKRLQLYQSDTDPFIQLASLNAYWQWIGQHGSVDHETLGKTNLEISKTQRLRIGGLIRALYRIDIEGQAVLDGNLEYQGLETLQIRARLFESCQLSLGKARVPFSYHNTLDHTQRRITRLPVLAKQIVPRNMLGALLEGTSNGTSGAISWGLGWYSADTNRNIPDADGGGLVLAKFGYFVPSGVDDKSGKSLYENYQHFYIDYLHNTHAGDSGNYGMRHRHLIATGLDLRIDNTDLTMELMYATGGMPDTVWGVNLEASRWLLDGKVRLVGRFEYADSNGQDALIVGFGPARALSDTGLPYQYSLSYTGDSYTSIYLGANIHLYGNNAILSTGVEYMTMDNTFATGQSVDAFLFHWNMRVAF